MSKEALKLALDFLMTRRMGAELVIDAIQEALAQPEPWCMKMYGCKIKCEDCPDKLPEQEPVGSVVSWVDGSLIHAWFGDPPPEGTLLYITPPRPWVGLTDEECMDAYDPYMGNIERARAIEAKLKEKNT